MDIALSSKSHTPLLRAHLQNIRINKGKKQLTVHTPFVPLHIETRSLNKLHEKGQGQESRKSSEGYRRRWEIQMKIQQNLLGNPETVGVGVGIGTYGQKQKQAKTQISCRNIQEVKKDIGQKSQHTSRRMITQKNKKCICGDCEECFKDFAYFLHIFSTDQSVPEISAKSWCIWRKNKNNKFMHYYGKRIHKVRQIASLTKILTSMTAIDFLNKMGYSPQKITYQIRKSSIMIGGTTANLHMGQIYTISQLLYGLMLPSGNDAGIAISQAIGLLYNISIRGKAVDPYQQNWYQPFLTNPNKSYSYHFIYLMNQKCQKLGLIDTHFYNSHGNDAYDQLKNVSTCNEVAKISSQFMTKYQSLKSVVMTKTYKMQRYGRIWQNTNKLLQDGFEGLKTGITDTAGPCLSASYKDLIVVVLNSKSMNQRWIQVKKLVRWFIRKNL